MTAPDSPRLDCLIPATDGQQDADQARVRPVVGARRKFARQGVLSALPTIFRIPGTARRMDRRYAV
jgi:hypothetical protein